MDRTELDALDLDALEEDVDLMQRGYLAPKYRLGASVPVLISELRSARAQLDAVRALHPHRVVRCFYDDHARNCTCLDSGSHDRCGRDDEPWPCPTVRALDAKPAP